MGEENIAKGDERKRQKLEVTGEKEIRYGSEKREKDEGDHIMQ